jgi:hypothetical protein
MPVHNTPEEKLIAILSEILKRVNLSEVFKVQSFRDNVAIRNSLGNPPSDRQKATRDSFIQVMQRESLFASRDKLLIPANPDRRMPEIRMTIIRGLNPRNIDRLYNALQRTPQQPNAATTDGSDNPLFRELPEIVKSHWASLSQAVRDHALECQAIVQQEALMRDIADSGKIGDTFRSPISLEHPDIPVRLPTLDREGKTVPSNEVYDLATEVLILRRKLNPTSRYPFTLNQIIAAPEARDALRTRRRRARAVEAAEERMVVAEERAVTQAEPARSRSPRPRG